jgi:hypothetical protein
MGRPRSGTVSFPRSGIGAAGLRTRAAVVGAACLLLAGCAAAEPTGSAAAPAGAAVDWRNTAYTVTCDGVVPDGLRTTVVDGRARVPADGSRPPHFDHYDIRVVATATGDVDGDDASDTVVLLECSPQPSNGIVQEVRVFSATGRPVGALPSPRTLRDGAVLPPVYDSGGLSVDDGEIVAAMKAYGPDDYHASGPSVPFTVRWRLDGNGFVQVSTS